MFRHLRFRTHPSPSLALPLSVRSTGHYLLDENVEELRSVGSFTQLFWCVDGSGKAILGKKAVALRPGTVFFYHPGEAHCLKTARSSLEYYWLTLDGIGAESMPHLFGFKRSQQAGTCPRELFAQLEPCLQEATAEGERKASGIAYQILLTAASTGSGKNLPDNQIHSASLAKSWLEEHFMDSRLNVALLSARFRIHRSTLYRIFLQQYGVPPVQYLSRLRLRRALELLNDSRLPVADVAVKAGIPDITYFSRLIRKNTGYSPRASPLRHGLGRPGSAILPTKKSRNRKTASKNPG